MQQSDKRWLLRFYIILILSGGLCSANDSLVFSGEQYWDQRASGAKGDHARSEYVQKAIDVWTPLLQNPQKQQEIASKWLEAYFYLLNYTKQSDSEKKRMLSMAKDSAEHWMQHDPENVEIAYWWAVHTALWARMEGPLSSIRAGVADSIRSRMERLSQSHQGKDRAMALLILGRIHQLLPKIPLLLSWPDKQLAERYLKESQRLWPQDIHGALFLAELFRDQKRWYEAAKVLKPWLGRQPRKEQKLEDLRSLWKMWDIYHSLTLTPQQKKQLGLTE